MKKQFLDSGKIVGTHGIKGEVRIEPWADSPAFLCAFRTLYLDERGETALRVRSRPHKNITLCKIEGVDTIEAAERLRGKIVYINRDDVHLDEGVHFVQDLIGSQVRDYDTDVFYGMLTDVLRTGANDVYEITRDGRQYLAPVIDEVVRAIDTENGVVRITPMKGIFDDAD
ncbi:MAG: ribosome maturation factor RimM [Ruminococcus sp.]|nr:ribosome maturation factor RimM [Ruminococcus sp.]